MDWIMMPFEAIPLVLLSTIGIYMTVILFTRISGLRTFAKMSSFDFAMTVAVGSLIAGTITTENPPLFQSIVALAGLYILQLLVAYLRKKGYKFIKIVDNQPLLLMDGPTMLEDNMAKAHVTHEDLLEKLRESNITRFEQIKAVVFETTGDVSVLSDKETEQILDFGLIENVKGANSVNKGSKASV
jgi:uncharacterized membrane protein YcaP (DUF421 family)